MCGTSFILISFFGDFGLGFGGFEVVAAQA
jgi:hypothetical protein